MIFKQGIFPVFPVSYLVWPVACKLPKMVDSDSLPDTAKYRLLGAKYGLSDDMFGQLIKVSKTICSTYRSRKGFMEDSLVE